MRLRKGEIDPAWPFIWFGSKVGLIRIRLQEIRALLKRAPNSYKQAYLESAEMIAIADSTSDGQYYATMINPSLQSLAPPGAVHRGGTNVLYCDGHVQWRGHRKFRSFAAGCTGIH